MGILDDAIREHLDLKRRQGADQDELARLEDEAFGPPTRPGDPEFAERGAEGGDVTTAEGERGGENGDEATATDTDLGAFHDQEAGPEAGTATATELEDETSLESDEAFEALDSTAPATDEPAIAPGEPTVAHDTLGSDGESDEIDLDIDLDLEEDVEEAEDAGGGLSLDDEEPAEATETPEAETPEAGTGETEAAAAEPIESLDTVEHHFEDAIDEAEVVEDEPESPAEGSLTEDSDDEDVLEETPEFLRDAPEDDELWFEQGEPKDFDF